MNDRQLQKMILTLLEANYAKPTTRVAAEFKAEYPQAWQELQKEGEKLYGRGCGSLQQPAARISQLLQTMPSGQVIRSKSGSETCWRLKI